MKTSSSSANGYDVYAFVLQWPVNNMLELGAPVSSAKTTVSMLGYAGNFKYTARSGGGIIVTFPLIPPNQMPCQWAWVLKITNLTN